jgi:predicted nucleic acid-binding protein
LLAPAEAREALDRFLAMPVEVSLPGILDREALELTITYGLPSAYDAYYVALAESLGCDLWTADRRLFDAVQGKLPFVRWVGDYGQR